jgi:hypothetical protein
MPRKAGLVGAGCAQPLAGGFEIGQGLAGGERL